jgi:hypothetical protein
MLVAVVERLVEALMVELLLVAVEMAEDITAAALILEAQLREL